VPDSDWVTVVYPGDADDLTVLNTVLITLAIAAALAWAVTYLKRPEG
jgi:hypothetical protein